MNGPNRIGSLLICLSLFLPASGNDEDSGSRWQLDLSGGLQFLAENDLSRFTEAENRYLDLYFRDNPYYSTQNDPGLREYRYIFSIRSRLSYRTRGRIGFNAGIHFLSRTSANCGVFSYHRDQSWRIIMDSLDYRAQNTSLSLIFPSLGLSWRQPLGSRLSAEIGLSAGPVFARAELKRDIIDRIEARELNPASEYLIYQDQRKLVMKGKGTGLGLGGDIRLHFPLNRHLGIFFETGYSFYHIPSLSGSGTATAGGMTREWNGEWFLVGERVEKEWGSASFHYPSNDPHLEDRSVRASVLDIHAFLTLQLGMRVDF